MWLFAGSIVNATSPWPSKRLQPSTALVADTRAQAHARIHTVNEAGHLGL